MTLYPMFVSKIDDALKEIDFEMTEEDRPYFYIYIFRTQYKIDLDYDIEYRPPKYFKLLHKMIKPVL
jgi:hypothetical protein